MSNLVPSVMITALQTVERSDGAGTSGGLLQGVGCPQFAIMEFLDFDAEMEKVEEREEALAARYMTDKLALKDMRVKPDEKNDIMALMQGGDQAKENGLQGDEC